MNAPAPLVLTRLEVDPAYERRKQRDLLLQDQPLHFVQVLHERGVRAVSPKQVMAFDCEEREATQEELDAVDKERPACRGDCDSVPRPCPFVGCAHHLFLGVTSTGGLVYYHRSPWEMDPDKSCALDMAERGPLLGEEIAEAVGITRQAVVEIEDRAIVQLRRKANERKPSASPGLRALRDLARLARGE